MLPRPVDPYAFESAIRPRLERISNLAGDLIASAAMRRPDSLGEAALEAELEATLTCVATTMEYLGLTSELRQLREEFARMRSGHRNLIEYDSRLGAFVCPALLCIERQITAILELRGLSDGSAIHPTPSVRHLEFVLQSTPCILRDRGIIPARESDITPVMRETLSYVFPDAIGEFTIGGTLKSFRPDAGIRSLRTAIEFKFVTGREEARRCIDAILADVLGYSGSAEWSRCIWVIYQTGSFFTQARVDAMCAEKRMPFGCRVIVVTGEGGRGKRSRGVAKRGVGEPPV